MRCVRSSIRRSRQVGSSCRRYERWSGLAPWWGRSVRQTSAIGGFLGNVLFAWELGGHLGHLGHCVPVAERLREHGHSVLFVVRDVASAEVLLSPRAMPFVAAPALAPVAVGAPPKPISYSEILLHQGYAEARHLRGLVNAWRNLFDLAKPDLIVSEAAPTPLLAARGTGIPRLSFGTGFFLPPHRVPLPPFLPPTKAQSGRLVASEARVLASANDALAAIGQPGITGVAEIFKVEGHLLCTLPEADHYGPRQGLRYVGPIVGADAGVEPDWPKRGGPRVFGYLKGRFDQVASTIESLARLGCSAALYLPDAPEELAERARDAGMFVARSPISMKRVAEECAVGITNAGHDTCLALLLAGKPLLCFPLQTEQYILARRFEATGAALTLLPGDEDKVTDRLQRLLTQPAFTGAAKAFAERNGHARGNAPVEAAVEACRRLMEDRPPASQVPR